MPLVAASSALKVCERLPIPWIQQVSSEEFERVVQLVEP